MSLFKSFIEILIVKLVYGEKLSLNHGMMNVVLDKLFSGMMEALQSLALIV